MPQENGLLRCSLLLDADNNSCSYCYASPNNHPLSYHHALPNDNPTPDNSTTHMRIRRLPEANGVETRPSKYCVRWEGKDLQLQWLLHDANDNSCSHKHACPNNNSLPNYNSVPNNHPSPNNQSVHMQKLLLPNTICVGCQS